MLTLLLYVVIVGLVAALLFLLAAAVFGRSEELGPLPGGTTATVLPARGVTGADVRALKFRQVVRGYRAAEVDWALDHLAARIDELQHELAAARQGTAAPAPTAPEPPAGPATDGPGFPDSTGPHTTVPGRSGTAHPEITGPGSMPSQPPADGPPPAGPFNGGAPPPLEGLASPPTGTTGHWGTQPWGSTWSATGPGPR